MILAERRLAAPSRPPLAGRLVALAQGTALLAALAWLAFITWPYVRAAMLSLGRKNDYGTQQIAPLMALVAGLAAIGLLVGALQRPRLSRLYASSVLAAAGLVVAAVLVAGGVAGGAAVVLWMMMLGWALGDRMLGLLFGRVTAPDGPERAVFSIALALGVFSHAILGLALLGLLYRWLGFGVLVLLSLVVWRDLLDKARAAARATIGLRRSFEATAEHWFALPLLALGASWAVLVFIQAVAPEVQYDALNYHLAAPDLYVEQHRLVETRDQFHSYFFLRAEMNYLLAMLLAGQTAAKLVSFAFLILTSVAIYAFGQRLFSARTGLVAAVLFATTPLVAWEASTAYVDLTLSCYCLLTIVAIYRWLVDRRIPWLVLGGVLAGFAVSTKLNAGILLAPFGVMLAAVALGDRRRPWRHRPMPLLIFGGAALLSVAPWPVLRYVQTGNPVFPFLNGVFKSPLWPAKNDMMNFADFGIGTDLGSLLLLPWAATFEAKKFTESMPNSVLGLGLLAWPIVALGRRRSRVAFLGLPLVLFSLAWAYTAQFHRYYLPALPLLSLLVGHGLSELGERSWSGAARSIIGGLARVTTLTWVLASLPLFASMFWQSQERIAYRVALGLESRSAYLTRAHAPYGAYEFLNERYPGRDTRILAISGEHRLYSSGSVESMHSPYLSPILDARDMDTAMRLIRERGFTHLLINRNYLVQRVGKYVVTHEAFLSEHAILEHESSRVEVYRFLTPDEQAVARSAPPRAQLLRNAGFEQTDEGVPLLWQPYGQARIDADGSRSHGGKVAVQASTDSGYTQAVPIRAGRRYTLGHHSRSARPDSRVRLEIRWLSGRGEVVDTSMTAYAATSEWAQQKMTATAPLGASTALIFASADEGRVWLDDYAFTINPD